MTPIAGRVSWVMPSSIAGWDGVGTGDGLQG
jgi:hypothetical protein